MPEMDGLEATRVIRDPSSKVLNHHIPVIAMTAHALSGDREECLQAGMNDYISKPFQPVELITKITHWAQFVRQEKDTNSQIEAIPPLGKPDPAQPSSSASGAAPTPKAPSSGIVASIEFEDLVKRVMGDKEMALNLISRAITILNKNLAELESGINVQNADQVYKLAHKMKGSAGNLSAEPLRQACEQIELSAKTANWDEIAAHQPKVRQAAADFLQAGMILLNGVN